MGTLFILSWGPQHFTTSPLGFHFSSGSCPASSYLGFLNILMPFYCYSSFSWQDLGTLVVVWLFSPRLSLFSLLTNSLSVFEINILLCFPPCRPHSPPLNWKYSYMIHIALLIEAWGIYQLSSFCGILSFLPMFLGYMKKSYFTMQW